MVDLLEKIRNNQLENSGQKKKLTINGVDKTTWEVYKIPLEFLYYNDKNGRINTAYKQYQMEHGILQPEVGKSEYNQIFEELIYESNSSKLKDTIRSIKEKSQQEPGVVLPDGRVIDGNRRFTALRKLERQEKIPRFFEAVVIPLDANSSIDEKKIKELELDLQLGREERVKYNPIDKIYDVYNTIVAEKLMTVEEYRKASGAKSSKGINKSIRLAELILKFIGIVSPGGDLLSKFYLARELELDGPINEIEDKINKLHKSEKEEITDAVLTYLAVLKANSESADFTRDIRDIKKNILNNDQFRKYFIEVVDDNVDEIIDIFNDNPIKNSNDLKKAFQDNYELQNTASSLKKSIDRLVYRGEKEEERRAGLNILVDVCEKLSDLREDDFTDLKIDEIIEAKGVLSEITDIIFKLKKELNR